MRRFWNDLEGWAKGSLIAVVVVAAIGIGAAIEGEDEKPEASKAAVSKPAPESVDQPSEQEVEKELTPALIVRLLALSEPGKVQKMCAAAETIGPELALASFKRGYKPGPNEPTAADVFVEIMSRC